jgi:hypothetical protein
MLDLPIRSTLSSTGTRTRAHLGLAVAVVLAACARTQHVAPLPAPSADVPTANAMAPAPEGPSAASSEDETEGDDEAELAAVAPAPPARESAAVGAARSRIVRAARALLGRRVRLDCSGYVLRAYGTAGVRVRLAPARSRTESLYRASHATRSPRPGDLAFFHRTYDRDHGRRGGNRFTHVALVESVEGSQVTLLHRGLRRVERLRMDLSRPSDPDANDRVRARRRGDGRATRYLAGELFAAFGELLDGGATRMLQAGRRPAMVARHAATHEP